MKIVNESGEIVPVNEKGELYVKGWPLFIEYKDQPELTAKAMSEDGWYKTGCVAKYSHHFITTIINMDAEIKFMLDEIVKSCVVISNILSTKQLVFDVDWHCEKYMWIFIYSIMALY